METNPYKPPNSPMDGDLVRSYWGCGLRIDDNPRSTCSLCGWSYEQAESDDEDSAA